VIPEHTYERGGDSGIRSSLMCETIKIIKNIGKWKQKIVVWELAGNSIVVPVLETIYEQLFRAKSNENEEVEDDVVYEELGVRACNA